MKPQDLQQIADLVAQKITKPRAKRKAHAVPAYMTEEEVARLLGVIDDARDKAVLTVAYYRGLRASELGLINLQDYHDNRLTIRRLKGSRGGEYHLTEAERIALKAWLRKRGNAQGPLFVSRNHAGISRSRLHRLIQKYCALAGIPPEKAHMHALKHSCGTHLSAREPDIVAIQDHMGHANIANTMKYVQIASRRRRDFADRLSGAGWGARKR